MDFWETVKSSIGNVSSNKMRTFLTTLGIIIGISAVIIITSLGAGLQKAMTDQFEQMGVTTINIMVGGGRNAKVTSKDLLTLSDVDVIKESEDVKYVSPTYQGRGTSTIKLLDPKETNQCQIQGVTSDYYYINNSTLLYGHYISEADVTARSKVVVINDTTAQKVFGYENAVGEKVSIKTRLGTQKYTVIGVLKNPNAEIETKYGASYSENIIMPISTLMGLYGEKTVNGITVNVKDKDNVTQAAENIVNLIEKAHDNEGKNIYYVNNPSSMLEQINSTLTMVTMFIGFVAGISLLVGGIGVMNIMMVTVTERTKEIGIRKSIGARNTDIRVQFIVEAIILTSIGGILGIVFGVFGGKSIANLIPEDIFGVALTSVISLKAVLFAFGISSVIGIVFGVYPANKAAKLDPIDALRYE